MNPILSIYACFYSVASPFSNISHQIQTHFTKYMNDKFLLNLMCIFEHCRGVLIFHSCAGPCYLCRTEKSRNETNAVCKHGPLDDIQVWQNDEDENSDSHGMQCLAEEHGEEFLGVWLSARLEEADPHGTHESPQFWHQVGYQQAPHPSYSLHLRQLCDELLLPTCRTFKNHVTLY